MAGQLNYQSRSRPFNRKSNRKGSSTHKSSPFSKRTSPHYSRSPSLNRERQRSSSPGQLFAHKSQSRSVSNDRKVRFVGPTICYGCNKKGHTRNVCKNCRNCGSSQYQRRNCPESQSYSKR